MGTGKTGFRFPFPPVPDVAGLFCGSPSHRAPGRGNQKIQLYQGFGRVPAPRHPPSAASALVQGSHPLRTCFQGKNPVLPPCLPALGPVNHSEVHKPPPG